MLQALRKFSKSWISAIFLGIIAFSFAVWGIGDIFRGNTDQTAVAVGDNGMSVTALQREYQNIVRNQGRAMGVDLTPEMALQAKFPERTVEMIADRLAKDNLAKDLKLTVSEAQVAAAIRSLPNFQGATGTFDHNLFLQAIGQAGFSEKEFLAVMRGDMTRSQLEQAVADGFVLPPRLLAAGYAQAMQTRAAEYIVLPASLAGNIAAPSDAQLDAYVKDNAARFSTPEYRDLSFATLSPGDLAAQVPVTDAEVEQEFEARRANYVTPEKRDIEQIVFPSEAEAKAAKAKIDSGTSFAALTTSRGLKPADIAIGAFTKAELDAARGNAAFALPADGVSQPVQGPFGWVLLRVTKITEGSNKTLDDVKEEIRTALQTQGAINKLIDIVNKFVDERAGGASIEQAARSSGMKYGRVNAVDANGNSPSGEKAALPSDPEFLTQAFSTEVGEDLEPVQAKSGNYFVLRVEGVTPPKLKPLAEIRDAAATAWTNEQRAARLKAKAAQLAEQATKQQSLAAAAQSAGATVRKTGALTRMSSDAVLTSDTIAALFLAKPGAAVSGPSADGDSYVVARVTGISNPRLPTGSEEVRQAAQQMSATIARDINDLTAKSVRQRDGVKINKALVSQATGEGS